MAEPLGKARQFTRGGCTREAAAVIERLQAWALATAW
jgi:hypothetical protein